ncbi:hypothetical protein HBI18_225810 [Parastagonospora nodorum]|nr:hypothetical protein HBI50_187670 [Parastagonospora nodorum]KAH5710194.1 hypothetical protein HBI18_225810 [Parastagonospora nodorum]KAH6420714.1 hypothetical protein HBI14_087530 [Parastagonospora nodorum]
MLSLFVLLVLLISQLSSGSPLLNHDFLSPRQSATNETDVSDFVRNLNLDGSAADALFKTLQNDRDVKALLTSKQYDKSSLARLSCEILHKNLGENVVSSNAVEQVVQQSWSEACWLIPTCIIRPQTAKDVSKALRVVRFFRTTFAVRSGGHSPNPGFSTLSDPGIMIDLHNLNHISINGDRSVATIEPGNEWIQVYEALDKYGVSVIGGRGPTVGAGGFMLGGGYFHWSGKYGMAADNVKDFEVVLADGTIVNANAKTNTDLFWALKGGGPNFGIVTKMQLYTVPIQKIWYQLGLYRAEQAPELIDAFAKWQNEGASDTRGSVGFLIGTETAFVGLFWLEPAVKPEVFAPFYDIPQIEPAAKPINSTLIELTNLLGFVGGASSARHDYRALTTRVDAELYKQVYEFWKPRAQALHNTTGANSTFVFQPVPKSVAEAGIAKGGNAMNIPVENQMWWSSTMDWEDAADDDTVRALSIETTNKWKELGQARGSYLPHLFMNDASRDQNPLASYGQKNLQRLKQIAGKYDPGQLFQKVQNSGFLLSKA